MVQRSERHSPDKIIVFPKRRPKLFQNRHELRALSCRRLGTQKPDSLVDRIDLHPEKPPARGYERNHP